MLQKQVAYDNKKTIDAENKKEVTEVIYDTVELYLEGSQWIAGDTMTIADFHYISTISTIKVSC